MGGLMDYNARFYSPYLNYFIQPDTLIPDTTNPQSWNRFSYVHNNPVVYNDPSGHCIWDGCIAEIMLVGAVIGAGIDIYNQYQENNQSFDNINWGEVAIAATVGAVAGVVTAAVIIPAAAGTYAAAYTGSAIIGTATEMIAGGFMAGTSNVILSNSQRVATKAVRGEHVTLSETIDDFDENYSKDMFYGALGYGVGRQFSNVANQFWRPSSYIGSPYLSRGFNGIGNMLSPNVSQKIISGASGAFSEAASNSSLIQSFVDKTGKK